jgi:FRG domain
MPITTITTIAEFANALASTPLKQGCTRFFRGHSDYKKYHPKPSIFRQKKLIQNEEMLIQEAIIQCPSELPASLSLIEVLVRLQHYSLPTRLLDLTSNALVALYFACRHKEKTEGEVLIFDIPNDEVKYYESDTVSVITGIAKRDKSFDLKNLPSDQTEFNQSPEIGRLLHDIKRDKPAFLSIIKRHDLQRVVAVRTRLDNARIAKQEGAFLLFGLDSSKLIPAQIPAEWLVCGTTEQRIVFSNKHRIKQELMSFGISEQSLFPELDVQAKAIVAKYTPKYGRREKAN